MKRLGDSGQSTLEFVMLAAIIFVMWGAITKVLKDRDFFQTAFGEPWGRLSNTIEFGVPSGSRTLAGAQHPAGIARHSTRKAK